jgi:hypothetical protein
MGKYAQAASQGVWGRRANREGLEMTVCVIENNLKHTTDFLDVK